jgi:inner membrane protein
VDNLTHTLFAATLARTRLRRMGRGTTAALVIASNAPDIDIVAAIRGGGVDYLQWHRGPTHGLLGIVGLGVLSAGMVWAGRAVRDRMRTPKADDPTATFRQLVTVSMLGVLLHVMMDFPTSYGTRLLSPFDWHWYTADLIPILDIYLLVVLAAALLFGTRSAEARRRNAAIALVFMAANYGARGVLHHEALGTAARVFGPALPPLCDERAAHPGPIDRWPRDWTVAPPPGASGRCLVEIAAMPDFVSPFRWRLVARFSGSYEIQDVDLLHPPSERPESMWRRTHRVPDHWPPAALTAAASDLAQVFLGFSRFPAVRTFDRPDGTTVVRWVDLRFGDGVPRRNEDPRAGSLFSAMVRIGPDGRIVEQGLGR